MLIPVGGAFHRVGVDIMELPLTQNGNRMLLPLSITSLSGLSHLHAVTRIVKLLLSFWLTMSFADMECQSIWSLTEVPICYPP